MSVGGMTGAVDKFEQYWRNRHGYIDMFMYIYNLYQCSVKETTDFMEPCMYIHIYIYIYVSICLWGG
jgi:hypothetical protein